jgi:hypothetical protein
MQLSVSFVSLFVLNGIVLAEPFATGLQAPQRLAFTPRGSLIVTEGGTPQPNSARISVLDRNGARRSLLEGLPSGLAHFTIPWGPKGLALDGRVMYLAIGDGDVMLGTPPDYGINPNGPSSPIFSSVLRLQFSAEIEDIQTAFTLTPDDHWALLDGADLELASGANRVQIRLLTAYRPVLRNLLAPGFPVRTSEPTGLFLDKTGSTLFVTDASGEVVSRIDPETGRSRTLTRFQPLLRHNVGGEQPVDNVPSAVCMKDGQILVSFLTAAPFPRGDASVKTIDPTTGAAGPLADGLTGVVDMACLASGSIAVVELTMDFANVLVPTGRVQLIDGFEKRVLASELPVPNAVAQDPVSGDLFVGTITGLIFRVPLS